MKKNILLPILVGIFLSINTYSQNVGINSTGASPDASAGLDIKFTDKGLLIPRVDISDLSTEAPLSSAATSILVYNTNTTTGPGYFYWDGSKWVKFLDLNDGKPWLLTGNSGTTAGTNFLGTTDAQDVVFKANNSEQFRALSGSDHGIGTPNGLYALWGRNAADNAWIRAILPAYTDDDIYIGSGANPSGTNIHLDVGGITNTALFVQGSNGYVGIGTANPLQKLQVTDDILIGAASNGGTPDGNAEGMKIWNSHSAWYIGVDNSSDESSSQSDENFFIGHNNDQDNEGLFNIQYSGYVGIGTATPSYQLDVLSSTADRTGSFVNTETSTDNYGVYGECAVTDWYGYGGYFKGGWYGVYGEVSPTGSGTYTGVRGYVSGGSGTNYGVYANATGSGVNYGVYGTVDRTGDHGIYGYNSTTSTTSDHTTSGVYGSSTYDVNGVTSNTVYNAAVMGWDDPPNNHDGIGVFGHCWPADNWGYGGWFNAGYYGVRAEGYSGDYYKSSNSNYSGGVLAKGIIGVNSVGSKFGIISVSKELGLLSIGNKRANYAAAYFDGPVIRNGYEAMLIETGETNTPAYTMVSNSVNIQTIGQGVVVNGSATINFDESFTNTVSSTAPIIVIITPTSNVGRLVVTNTSTSGFDVISENNSNGSFNWIAIGKVKGYENVTVKQEYKNTNFINDEIEKTYPQSKGFNEFGSEDFFKTQKLKKKLQKGNIDVKENTKNISDEIIEQ